MLTTVDAPPVTVRLQNTQDGHHKEYLITCDDAAATVTVAWGRIGYATQSKVHEFSSATYAVEFAEEKLSEKIDGGYVVVDDVTAAAPMECHLTTGPAPIAGDDDRVYLVAATDCYARYVDLVVDGDRGGRCAQITGSQALVDYLLTTKTGRYFDATLGTAVRHRIVGFEVTPRRGATEYYTRRDGQVFNEYGVAI